MTETISKHFRKIENKKENEKFQIKNIDFIYLINLDRRPERLNYCLQQFAPYQIVPHRVPGIDGWSYTQDVFNDIAMILSPGMQYDQRVHFRFVPCLHKGEMLSESSYGKPCVHEGSPAGGLGGAMAHLSILDDACASHYQTVWILEDDFTIKHSPHFLADYVKELSQLEPEWDVLYTDDDDYFTASNLQRNFGSGKWLRPGLPMTTSLIERTAIGDHFFKIGGRTQAHSVIYSHRGAQKIVNYLKTEKFFLPYDTELPCIKGLNMYNLKYDIVHGRNRHSSDTATYRP